MNIQKNASTTVFMVLGGESDLRFQRQKREAILEYESRHGRGSYCDDEEQKKKDEEQKKKDEGIVYYIRESEKDKNGDYILLEALKDDPLIPNLTFTTREKYEKEKFKLKKYYFKNNTYDLILNSLLEIKLNSYTDDKDYHKKHKDYYKENIEKELNDILNELFYDEDSKTACHTQNFYRTEFYTVSQKYNNLKALKIGKGFLVSMSVKPREKEDIFLRCCDYDMWERWRYIVRGWHFHLRVNVDINDETSIQDAVKFIFSERQKNWKKAVGLELFQMVK